MKRYLTSTFLFLISLKSLACLNGETKTLKNGVLIYEDHQGIVPYGHEFYIDNYPKLLNELDSLYQKTNDLDYLSDKGYVLILQKKYQEALDIYFKIEQLQPNRYSTASNVGTIYELIGNNQKALEWINKAIRINPKSHNSSEWLHVKILQAKISGSKFITSNFLINTTFGENDEPFTKLTKPEIKALIKTIYYQLNERISFIEPKDEIIGLLLFELGNLALLDGKSEDAISIYMKARQYGFQSDLIDIRINVSRWKIEYAFHDKIGKLTNDNYKLKKAINHGNIRIKTLQNRINITIGIALIIIIILSTIIFKLRKSK